MNGTLKKIWAAAIVLVSLLLGLIALLELRLAMVQENGWASVSWGVVVVGLLVLVFGTRLGIKRLKN